MHDVFFTWKTCQIPGSCVPCRDLGPVPEGIFDVQGVVLVRWLMCKSPWQTDLVRCRPNRGSMSRTDRSTGALSLACRFPVVSQQWPWKTLFLWPLQPWPCCWQCQQGCQLGLCGEFCVSFFMNGVHWGLDWDHQLTSCRPPSAMAFLFSSVTINLTLNLHL